VQLKDRDRFLQFSWETLYEYASQE
jgi:hypothetical protein